jgi:predicted GH43/DUF377 family glycosyl hydrolase/serine/threonine protein kinase
MGAEEQSQVFISYAGQDADLVLEVVRLLEKEGFRVWRDRERVIGGQYYGEQIVHAIAHSRVVLLMCSPDAFRSDNVHREVLLTWERYHRRYIPVWISQKVEIPERFIYCLVGCQFIDAHSQPPERWLPQLLEAFKSLGVDDQSGLRFRPGDRPIRGTDWELEQHLGKGGFGEVWKARIPNRPELAPVALKFCLDLNERSRQALQNEAAVVRKVQAQIEADGIVPLLAAYLDNDPPCLEYRYIDGGTLVGLLDERRGASNSFTPVEVQRVIHRIAQVVALAHRATPKLIHRDLKPSNVLVERRADGENMLWVTDFGVGAVLAQPVLNRSHSTSSLEGNISSVLTGAFSPLYASPQQIRGEKADPRDDVYAIGVIWYQLLIGNLTFPAPPGRMWIEKLRRSGMRKESIDLLSSCFESDPADRPSDAGELAERLQALPTFRSRNEAGRGAKGAQAPANPELVEVSKLLSPTPSEEVRLRTRARLNVRRTGIVLKPSNSRVVIRPFEMTDLRSERIIARIMSNTEAEVDLLVRDVMQKHHNRHLDTRRFLLHRFVQVRQYLLTDQHLSENRRMLIGSHFTQEYALESAGLFNPSMVWHPDQSGLPPGARRFVLSLRATGEGGISSITFRSGTIDPENQIRMDEPTRFVARTIVAPGTLYDKTSFVRKLADLSLDSSIAENLLAVLSEQFTLDELQLALNRIADRSRPRDASLEPVMKRVLNLARSNYEISYSPEHHISERVILPSSPAEAKGIEDARFVRFDDDGWIRYYATCTAFDGEEMRPQILETDDFLDFKISTLHGPEARHKGFALFPRKVRGLYAMLSQQDNENIYLMFSEVLDFWYTKELISKPVYAWEYVQIGNCGSPIETDAGWLVLTHGLSPMHNSALGACLLDLEDPSRVIGRLEVPLLEPDANEREGSVPNGVYSCGGALHNGELIIPYSMSDYATTFATVSLDEVLEAMVRD